MNFLFKFPSRGRPQRFKEVLIKHLDHLSGKHNYKFIFSFDNDDSTMNNDEIVNFIKDLKINHEIFFGDNKSKIEAYNANLENQIFDVLILLQDDLLPELKNYDDIISDIFINSPYGLDCVIHFNTKRWCQLLNIWNIIGKKYYDRFNYIYYPGYKSISCDNEFTEVSKMLNRSIWSSLEPFSHNWVGGDDTEKKNWYFNADVDRLFWERRKINYGLSNNDIVYFFDNWDSIIPTNGDGKILKLYE